jgi:ferrous iron transport protein A
MSMERRIRMALSELMTGQHGVVQSLDGGRMFRSRAANLGFTAGAEVTVVQNYGRGPMIVAVRGTRVALGRGEASMVLVEGA